MDSYKITDGILRVNSTEKGQHLLFVEMVMKSLRTLNSLWFLKQTLCLTLAFIFIQMGLPDINRLHYGYEVRNCTEKRA